MAGGSRCQVENAHDQMAEMDPEAGQPRKCSGECPRLVLAGNTNDFISLSSVWRKVIGDYASTVGLEMAVAGDSVVVAGDAHYHSGKRIHI